jgi:UDP-2,3-diacylglucosamine hydrolase
VPAVTRLGILAGGGGMPVAIAESVLARGREVHIVGIKGAASPEIERFSHTWMSWVEVGRLLEALKQHDCDELVIIGGVRRPNLKALRIDWGTIRAAPVLYSLLRGGDDSILSRIARFFEQHGLKVRGAHEVAPDLLAWPGAIGKVSPNEAARADIAKGLAVLRALGAHDVGQAVVVARGYVLAVEAAEGTDAMLERAAGLRQWGGASRKTGVLIKRSKPGQDLRVDLPVIGPRTVELASAAGLAGIAVLARHVLLAERARLVSLADRQGLFVYGVEEAADGHS